MRQGHACASSLSFFRLRVGEILLDGAKLPRMAAERSRDQLRRIQLMSQMADTAFNPEGHQPHTPSRARVLPLPFR